jgi:hypothetical protein
VSLYGKGEAPDCVLYLVPSAPVLVTHAVSIYACGESTLPDSNPTTHHGLLILTPTCVQSCGRLHTQRASAEAVSANQDSALADLQRVDLWMCLEGNCAILAQVPAQRIAQQRVKPAREERKRAACVLTNIECSMQRGEAELYAISEGEDY